MPYGQARRLPAPGVPSTDRLNLYPTPIADGTVIWTTPPGKTYTTHLPLRFGDFREAAPQGRSRGKRSVARFGQLC